MEFAPQWFFWGYSLAFGETDNGYIGNLKHFALMGVDGQPSMGSIRIPALVFAIYQCMFAVITSVFAAVQLVILISFGSFPVWLSPSVASPNVVAWVPPLCSPSSGLQSYTIHSPT